MKAVPTRRLNVLFEDTFGTRIKPDWEPLSGDWRIINGKLGLIPKDNQYALIVVGQPTWEDYAIEAEVFHTSSCPIGILVRLQDGNNMMAYRTGLHSISGWWICRNGKWTRLVSSMSLCDQNHFRIEVKGNVYSAYANGEFISSISDDTYSSGRAGVGFFDAPYKTCSSDKLAFSSFSVLSLEE